MTRHNRHRADEIVAAIAEYRLEHGYGPSVRELRDMAGLASTSAVQHHLTGLLRAGRITHEPFTPRTLAIVSRVVMVEDGCCARPGCGKPLPDSRRGPRRVWCSTSCAVIAMHVRRWMRAVGAEDILPRIGMPS